MSRGPRELAWLLPFGLLVGALVLVPLRMLDPQGLPRYRALREEKAAVEHLNDRLRREVRDLQRHVRALRTDPDALERVARDDLGMIRDDELLFVFTDDE
jgi:cell division protein FtsB